MSRQVPGCRSDTERPHEWIARHLASLQTSVYPFADIDSGDSKEQLLLTVWPLAVSHATRETFSSTAARKLEDWTLDACRGPWSRS